PSSDPILQPHNLVERISPVDRSRIECTAVKQTDLRLIARNVSDFSVSPIEPCPPGSPNCTPYGQGYRIDISIFGYDDNKADKRAGALYHRSSVITPLTFGDSK
ncbi:MAG TPA: hypothetical protein VKT80_10800, partial [Chloroflexota bacterium]|nr:hypothetical protein [Chloroflexota bacterium]